MKKILRIMALVTSMAFCSCDFVGDSKGDDDGSVSAPHVIDEYCSLSQII